MKPNFALSLSFEGISLLHRAFPGWNRVGEVALDSPDLSGALAVLRDTAGQINGPEITSKLVIPNDQIKYLSLDLGLMAEDDRRAAIREALDGATPYPVDDLAFDWSVEGDKTLVAAVARETLAEAEEFADSHGFGPVSFVAIPPEGAFSGEPFFGQTRLADKLLGEADHVQRDMAAIRITGVVRLPDPGDEAESLTDAPPAPEPDEASEAAPQPEAAPEHAATEHPAPAASEPEPEEAPGGDTPETAPQAEPCDRADTPPNPEPAPAEFPVFGHTTPDDLDTAADESDTATVLSDTLPSDSPEPTPENEAEPDATLPPFSTIRAHRDEAPASAAPSLSGVRRADEALTAPTIAVPLDTEPDTDAAAAIEATPFAPHDEVHDHDIPPMPPHLAQSLAASARAGAPMEDDLVEDGLVEDGLAEPGPAEPRETRLSAFGRRGSEMASGLAGSLAARRSAPPLDDDTREDERRRMTVFGARSQEKTPREIGGKPRYLGLILSLVLLLFLAGVAAWASIFMDDGLSRFFGSPRQSDVATLPPGSPDETSIEGDEAGVPDGVPDNTPDNTPAEIATLEAAPEPADAAQLETASLSRGLQPEDTAPPAKLQHTLPHALTQREAQARYAVTGVWQRAPQAPQLPDQLSLDDLYVASIDPAVDAQDAVALPDRPGLDTDVAMARVPLPAARGSRFALDERGLVIASAAGTLSPEGFLVFAGRPSAVPAALPQRGGAITAKDRSRLAAKRPRPRPEGLVEQNERSTLGGLTRSELAAKRPRLRPALPESRVAEESATPEAQAEAQPEAQPEVTPESTPEVTPETGAATAAAIAAAIESGTEFAVAASRKPRPRPSNFAKLVERARKTEQSTEAQATTRVAAAVPRSQVTAPAAPSRASVAKAATVRNQLNLRKVNLIGVYGKPSSRRALVRLSNGRYKKVKVGDRLDGGRVQSIGDAELRYSKGGRNVILKMPKG